MAYWLLKYIFLGPLLAILGRPKIEGLEHVPQSGPAILASNHLAVMDSFYLPLVVRRRITFLAKSEYFTGTGFKGCGAGGSSPPSARCRSTAVARTQLRPRWTPPSEFWAKASCSACIPKALARPTAGSTKARSGWRGWRWRPASR